MLHFINETEMSEFGRKLGNLLKPNMVLTLNGELGAGKTTLTKAIAKAMGISEHITSPTFTILQEYDNELPLFHFDAYRIADEEEMYFIGFEEYLQKGGVTIIEWASLISGVLPKERLDIFIYYSEDGGRDIELLPRGKAYEELENELRKSLSLEGGE